MKKFIFYLTVVSFVACKRYNQVIKTQEKYVKLMMDPPTTNKIDQKKIQMIQVSLPNMRIRKIHYVDG